MEQTGVDEVTSMEKDAAKLWFTSLTSGIVVGIDKIIMLIAKLWFTSLTSGIVVGIDKIIMLIALVVFRIGWWATI